MDEMDFSQIASAWNDGKRAKGVAISNEAEIEEINRNWRRYFYGL